MTDSAVRALRVGLTGGIACGKSTVGRMLEDLGACVVDADRLARELLDPGQTGFARVVAAFGDEVVGADGCIDRPALARRVFADPDARRTLDRIVHPLVRRAAEDRFAAAAAARPTRIVVFDAALLVETGAYRDFHKLIVVSCDRPTQLRRLLARGGFDLAQAEVRIDAQAPLEAKTRVADYVIDTGSSLDFTREQTERVYTALLADQAAAFGG